MGLAGLSAHAMDEETDTIRSKWTTRSQDLLSPRLCRDPKLREAGANGVPADLQEPGWGVRAYFLEFRITNVRYLSARTLHQVSGAPDGGWGHWHLPGSLA